MRTKPQSTLPIILLSLLLLSCDKLAEEEQKEKSTKLFFNIEGKYDSLGNRTGRWEYKDEEGEIIKVIYYFPNPENNYSIRYYHQKKIIYLEDYRKGILIYQMSFGKCSNTQESAGFLFRSNCSVCHEVVDSIQFKSIYVKDKNKLTGKYLTSLFKYDTIHHKDIFLHIEDCDNLAEYIKNNFQY